MLREFHNVIIYLRTVVLDPPSLKWNFLLIAMSSMSAGKSMLPSLKAFVGKSVHVFRLVGVCERRENTFKSRNKSLCVKRILSCKSWARDSIFTCTLNEWMYHWLVIINYENCYMYELFEGSCMNLI